MHIRKWSNVTFHWILHLKVYNLETLAHDSAILFLGIYSKEVNAYLYA